MNLAAAGDGCDGGIDFLGMFGDPIGTMIQMVAEIIITGALGVFDAVWDIESTNPGASGKISNQTRWIVVYLACGSILFAAAKMALNRRAESGQLALKGMLRVLVVSAGVTAIIGTFVDLTDRYSDFLLRGTLQNLMEGIDCNGNVPNMLLLVIGVLLLIAGIIHALLMWIRLGVMIILMGTLPIAAAASMTDWGGTWWRKHVGWMAAWLLYKPTVALVLYSGSVMVDASEAHSDVDTQIAGMGLLLLSAVALPALMRLIVPATAALGGDSVGSTTMGVAGGVASGAVSLADSGGRKGPGGSGGSGGPAGSRGPSGASGGTGASGGAGASGAGGRSGAGGGAGPAGQAGAASAGGAAAGAGAGAAANPALAALVAAGKIANGTVNVAASGVQCANRYDDR
ncbi:hypothetical protein [Streptomyces sp. B93]|uniref:hypothetical protein n=1 Tax=Streptomyces sp. B93 TaxID=2824875 RepID=UPI001B39519F|nr:hypothetical protein [Streptomyces sp. B93]MBQ1093493.1 hypothetical protein [Streptomyces sp. B93]